MSTTINVKIAPLPRGAWSNSATYAKLDVVSYNGSSYMAIKAVSAGTLPTNTTYWQLLAEQPTITDGSITTNKIADGAVTSAKIEDGAVGKDELEDGIYDAILNSYPNDIASGEIANFPDGADNIPVRKLTLNLVPYQGGSGEPAPDNVRPIYPVNGKNLYDSATREDGYISATGVVTVDGSSVHSALIPVTPNQPIVFSGKTIGGASSSNKRLHGYNSSGTWVQQLGHAQVDDGKSYTISATVPSGITGVKISLRGTDEQVQVEHGISPSAYVPYNGIGITRTEKNLFKTPYEEMTIDPTTGIPSSSNAYRAVNLIKVNQGTYTLSWTGTSTDFNFRYFLYDKNGNFIGVYNVTGTNVRQTINITEDCYISFRWSNSLGLTDLQLEKGAFTSYEPYQGTRYYIDSSTPIYGGTLEVETGVLTVTHKGVDLVDYMTSWTKSSTYLGGFYKTASNFGFVGHTPFICSHAKTVTALGSYVFGTCYCDNSINIRIMPDNATVQDWYDYIQAQHNAGTPIVVCAKLSTPQTYQLTPTQVTALLGVNNIWTDSGTVEVNYLADTSLYIQKLTGSTEEDMVANANIASGKYFMVGNRLFYSTSAIAQGANIVVGTNCTETNLAEALNTLNS